MEAHDFFLKMLPLAETIIRTRTWLARRYGSPYNLRVVQSDLLSPEPPVVPPCDVHDQGGP